MYRINRHYLPSVVGHGISNPFGNSRQLPSPTYRAVCTAHQKIKKVVSNAVIYRTVTNVRNVKDKLKVPLEQNVSDTCEQGSTRMLNQTLL